MVGSYPHSQCCGIIYNNGSLLDNIKQSTFCGAFLENCDTTLRGGANFLILVSTVPGHGCMDDLATAHSFDKQATCAIDGRGLYFDMPFMGVCTTGHWRTSGRLVQELNVCTVCNDQALADVRSIGAAI